MKSTNILFVTSRTAMSYKRLGKVCSNPSCKKPEVETNEFVVTKNTHGRRKLYCIDCALRFNIITKVELKKVKVTVR
jgi:hypothetical protein